MGQFFNTLSLNPFSLKHGVTLKRKREEAPCGRRTPAEGLLQIVVI